MKVRVAIRYDRNTARARPPGCGTRPRGQRSEDSLFALAHRHLVEGAIQRRVVVGQLITGDGDDVLPRRPIFERAMHQPPLFAQWSEARANLF